MPIEDVPTIQIADGDSIAIDTAAPVGQFALKVRRDVVAYLADLFNNSDPALGLGLMRPNLSLDYDPGTLGALLQTLNSGGGSGGTGGGPPDLTPPPTPTGVMVRAGFSSVIVECGVQSYTQGHGHLASIVYAAEWEPGAPQPEFDDAERVSAFLGTIESFPSDPGVRWCVWLTWASVDGVESTVPAGGTHGYQVTTSEDVRSVLKVLENQITASQLYTDLALPIGTLLDRQEAAATAALANILAGHKASMQRAADLLAEANDRGTAITLANTLRDQGDSQLAQQILTLTAKVNSGDSTLTAALQLEQSTRADADTAEALERTTLAAEVQHPTTGLAATRATLATDYSTTVAMNASLASLSSTLSTNFAAADASTLATANAFTYSRSAIDGAISASATTLTANYQAADIAAAAGAVATANAFTTSYTYSTAGVNGAISSAITTYSATVNGQISAAVAVEAAARVALDGSVHALYTVQAEIAAGGQTIVGGYGLSATSTAAAGPRIAFGVRADEFFVAAPAGTPGATGIMQPFVIKTTTWSDNGVSRPAGMYVEAANIANLTAVYATIATLVAGTVVATDIRADKILAGELRVGGYLASTNFVAGTSGWRIHADGTAELAQVIVRGYVYAIGGTIGGVQIGADYIQSTNFVTGISGWRWKSDGTAEGTSITLRNPTIIRDAGPVQGFAASSQQVVTTGTAAVALSLLSDGRIQKTVGVTNTIVGNWFLPTTTGIGSSYKVVASATGDTVLDPTKLNRELVLTSGVSFALQKSSPIGEKVTAITLQILNASGVPVGNGLFSLNATFDV